MVRAEFGKLRRSLSWAVVLFLPIMAVASGTAATIASGEGLGNGWHTLWLRVVVFYGLAPLTLGVAALASLVWRVEHEDGNRNALMSGPTSGLRVMTAKLVVLAVLAAAMQAVLVAGAVVVGTLVFALPGGMPGRYVLVSALIVLACLPVAALQSGLSMLLRSFAAPVALALAGAVVSVGLVTARIDVLVPVVPYALLARATQLGTGTFADPGVITPGVVITLTASAVALTALLIGSTAAMLDRRDVPT